MQLFPYNDTPNNGGVYKVWVTQTSQLDCAAPGNKNCFVPRYSKTDNFKVRNNRIVEIDTRFWKSGQAEPVDGLLVVWTDTNGASNTKYSEYNPAVLAFHEAHVEAAEQGNHRIQISDQANCTIDHVVSPTGVTMTPAGGTVTVPVAVRNHNAGDAQSIHEVRRSAGSPARSRQDGPARRAVLSLPCATACRHHHPLARPRYAVPSWCESTGEDHGRCPRSLGGTAARR